MPRVGNVRGAGRVEEGPLTKASEFVVVGEEVVVLEEAWRFVRKVVRAVDEGIEARGE